MRKNKCCSCFDFSPLSNYCTVHKFSIKAKTRLHDPASWLPWPRGEFTEPSLHLLAKYCIPQPIKPSDRSLSPFGRLREKAERERERERAAFIQVRLHPPPPQAAAAAATSHFSTHFSFECRREMWIERTEIRGYRDKGEERRRRCHSLHRHSSFLPSFPF